MSNTPKLDVRRSAVAFMAAGLAVGVGLPAGSASAATKSTSCAAAGSITRALFAPPACVTSVLEVGPSGTVGNYSYTARVKATAVAGSPAAKIEFFTDPGGANPNATTCASSTQLSCTASRSESGWDPTETGIWIRCSWNSSALVALAALDCKQTLTTYPQA